MKSFKHLFEEFNGTDQIIYVDMDGVLCDFIGGVKKVTGQDFTDPDLNKLVKKEIKDQIQDYGRFWHELEWHDGGRELWQRIRKYNPQILSAYPKWDHNGIPGKHEWTRKNLKLQKNRANLVQRHEKSDYATNSNGRPNILIDDYIKNIREFEDRGGIGIHHINTSRTIAELKKLGL